MMFLNDISRPDSDLQHDFHTETHVRAAGAHSTQLGCFPLLECPC